MGIAEAVYKSGKTLIDRQEWMALLSWVSADRLDTLWGKVAEAPSYSVLRPSEGGLVMTRGRVGGSGAPFNLGEMTVTRCSVRLEDGTIGHAYQSGRDKAKAERSAVIDAMLQTEAHAAAVDAAIIAPLRTARMQADCARAAKIAPTKVNFFTMVRGEDG